MTLNWVASYLIKTLDWVVSWKQQTQLFILIFLQFGIFFWHQSFFVYKLGTFFTSSLLVRHLKNYSARSPSLSLAVYDLELWPLHPGCCDTKHSYCNMCLPRLVKYEAHFMHLLHRALTLHFQNIVFTSLITAITNT